MLLFIPLFTQSNLPSSDSSENFVMWSLMSDIGIYIYISFLSYLMLILLQVNAAANNLAKWGVTDHSKWNWIYCKLRIYTDVVCITFEGQLVLTVANTRNGLCRSLTKWKQWSMSLNTWTDTHSKWNLQSSCKLSNRIDECTGWHWADTPTSFINLRLQFCFKASSKHQNLTQMCWC